MILALILVYVVGVMLTFVLTPIFMRGRCDADVTAVSFL